MSLDADIVLECLDVRWVVICYVVIKTNLVIFFSRFVFVGFDYMGSCEV